MYIVNCYLSSWLGTIQILVKSIRFYFYFGRKTEGKYKKAKIGIKSCRFYEYLYLMKDTFGVKKVWPSKVEPYLEVNV